jgi:hypothetical protein
MAPSSAGTRTKIRLAGMERCWCWSAGGAGQLPAACCLLVGEQQWQQQ